MEIVFQVNAQRVYGKVSVPKRASLSGLDPKRMHYDALVDGAVGVVTAGMGENQNSTVGQLHRFGIITGVG